MNRLSKMPKYVFAYNGTTFNFDSIEYESGTKVSDYEILTNGLSSAVNGVVPLKITLKGRFLADEYEDLEGFFLNHVGEVLSLITINDKQYSRVVLLKVDAYLPPESNIGEMTFILQRMV